MVVVVGFRADGEWTFSNYIGIQSYFFKATFLVWNPAHWRNKTDDLWEDSFDESPISVTLGVLGAIVNWYGWLQEHALLDIVLLLSVAVTQHMSKLIRHIEDEDENLDAKWTEYEELKKSCTKINYTFQYFLPLAHVNNLFLLSYFLLRVYERKARRVYIVLHGFKVVKMMLTYYITSAAAHKVSKYFYTFNDNSQLNSLDEKRPVNHSNILVILCSKDMWIPCGLRRKSVRLFFKF